jgi:TusA-related sulfurtransferase
LDEIKSIGRGELSILVDTDTSKENVSRAAEGQGWQVLEVKTEDSGYNVRIRKG